MTARTGDGPVRVLIVDDSRTIRALLRTVAAADPRVTVVGEAADPYEARAAIKALDPDVLTLDVEMPRMCGLDFLERLMRLRPMPVVMVSTRTRENSREAVRALALGAVDCIDLTRFRGHLSEARSLVDTLIMAAGAAVRGADGAATAVRPPARRFVWNGMIVLVGSSTGGVDALERMLSSFPADGPPVLIAQHMPATFLTSFAERLDERLAPEVQVAESGVELTPGQVLLAPGGGVHLELRAGPPPRTRLVEDQGDTLYVPSVDLLFRSGLRRADGVVAILLTGMGRDGAEAMAALRAAGAETIAQSGETCVIDGMPRAARALGAASQVLPLGEIGAAALSVCGAFQTEPA